LFFLIGAGISFGADVARKFLKCNNLKLVIRSHECVRSGYDEPYHSISGGTENNDNNNNNNNNNQRYNDIQGPLLCTIFSASDYGGSGNSAAYIEMKFKESLPLPPVPSMGKMETNIIDDEANDQRKMFLKRPSLLMMHEQQAKSPTGTTNVDDHQSEIKFVPNSNLVYNVHYYYANPLKFDQGSQSFPTHHGETFQDFRTLYPNLSSKDSMVGAESPMISTKSNLFGDALDISMEPQYASQPKLIGSARILEDLICDRKQYLLESFQKADQHDHGHIHLKEWIRVMSDILNISLSWKNFSKYLIGPQSIGFCQQFQEMSIDYKVFLDSFVDEIGRTFVMSDNQLIVVSRQNSTMSANALSRVITSSTVAGAASSPAVNSTASSPTNTGTVISPNDIEVALRSAANISTQENGFFHEHDIFETTIKAIYSNYKYVEAAYYYFDSQHNGFFTLQDLINGLEELNIEMNNADNKTEDGNNENHDSSFLPSSPEEIMMIMDIYECGHIDMNLFFELYRWSCLSSLYLEDASYKPLLRRETSVANEVHRLSVTGLSSTLHLPNVAGHHLPPASLTGHNALTTIELVRGKELIVDAELAGSELRHLHEQHHHDSLKSHNHEAVSPSPETVGLSIDI
jgi:hypothetical protein